jgi:hypothetical protein
MPVESKMDWRPEFRRLMEQVPPKDRRLDDLGLVWAPFHEQVASRYSDGATPKEIADQMKIRQTNVSTALSQAKIILVKAERRLKQRKLFKDVERAMAS